MNILLSTIASQGGWTVVIVGIVIVFAALYVLSLIFDMIPYLMKRKIRFNLKRSGKLDQTVKEDINKIDVAGDTNAAIAMALHLFFSEDHDEESNIVTIKKLSKRYSPWNSKIYNVSNWPK